MAYSPELIYKGNQVIVASGRIVFNAKDDAVLIFAKKTIGFSSAGSIHFNSDDMMVVNSPKIYLGLEYSSTRITSCYSRITIPSRPNIVKR